MGGTGKKKRHRENEKQDNSESSEGAWVKNKDPKTRNKGVFKVREEKEWERIRKRSPAKGGPPFHGPWNTQSLCKH